MQVFVLLDVDEPCAVHNRVVDGNIQGIHAVTSDRIVAKQWEAMGKGLYKAVEFELNELWAFDDIANMLGSEFGTSSGPH
jgi:hypothetical protein